MRVLLPLFVVASFAVAQTPAEFVGVLRTIDGRTIDGRLEVATDGSAKIATTTLSLADVASFERRSAVTTPVPGLHHVWLRSGQHVAATKLAGKPAASGTPSMLTITLPSGLVFDVPFTTVRALRHGGSERPEPALFQADLNSAPANDDLVYVQKDGKAQRSAVKVSGFTADTIEFTLRGDEYDFPLLGLTAVVFGKNTGFAPDRQPRPRATIDLDTGESLEGRVLEIGNVLRLRLDEGAVIDVAPQQLVRLRIASDRLAWLSDLPPRVEQTPAFDRVWPWTIDRSPAGPGIVLGKKTFSRGVGMVPRTRLTYDLGGAYDVLEATIGIDDRGGPDAHAIFRVLVDGNVAFESQGKTLATPPEAIRVELNKCRQLAIEVDFGKNYDLGDYCVFADARVVQR